MKIIPIVRRGYQIFVTPLTYYEIDFSLCSQAFKNHVEKLWTNKDLIIHVKCDSQGNIELRKAKHNKQEYRILDISKIKNVDVHEFSPAEYKIEKTPCPCICHKEGITVMHVRPCCNNGFKEKLIKINHE
jgi:hypothetical protein